MGRLFDKRNGTGKQNVDEEESFDANGQRERYEGAADISHLIGLMQMLGL